MAVTDEPKKPRKPGDISVPKPADKPIILADGSSYVPGGLSRKKPAILDAGVLSRIARGKE